MDDVLATVEVQRRRFTVDEYHRLTELGILTESGVRTVPGGR